jgi:hypothetical protein
VIFTDKATYVIRLNWDAESGVWYSDCDSVPILLESESLDDLIDRVVTAAPEILELNGLPPASALVFSAARIEALA